MDKAKTLEVLRGMKFMQRKEEAKRRALFEAEQREEIESRLAGGSSDDHGGAPASSSEGFSHTAASCHGRGGDQAGPTILYDLAFPTSAYALSRRVFHPAASTPGGDEVGRKEATTDGNDGSAVATASSSSVHADNTTSVNAADAGKASRKRARNKEDEEEEEDESAEHDSESEGNEDSEDPSAPAYNSAHGQASSRGRFYVEGGIRAPKLPKRLERDMAERAAKAKSKMENGSESEHDEDYDEASEMLWDD